MCIRDRDEVIEREKEVLGELDTLLNSYIWRIFTAEILSNSKKHLIKCKSLFQTQWTEREFPQNWRCLKISEVLVDSQNGFAEGKRDNEGLPQLRMNNVTRDGRINLEKISMIPYRQNIEKYLIQNGDVLFCNTNSEDLVGKSIIANKNLHDFSFSNHFTRLRVDKNLITGKFLYLWLKFHFDIGLFERLCTRWIGQAAVQSDTLKRLQIVLPSVDEQVYAGKYCQGLEDQMDVVNNKISSSQALQKSLINQIFS